MVTRLVLSRETTDEAVGKLVLRFPTVVSLEVKSGGATALTDQGVRAVSSLASLTFLDLRWCKQGYRRGRASSHKVVTECWKGYENLEAQRVPTGSSQQR
jgi:hypothetical protein